MEVNRRYKQTEVGVIPVEWTVRKLVEISSQITDGDHLTPKRARSGFYLLSARNVRDGWIDLTDVDYVDTQEFKRMRLRCAPDCGDLLISCSGHGLGRVAIVPQGLQCVLVRSAAMVKLEPEKADSRFIQYWLQGANAQKQISNGLSRAAQPNLFLNSIERLSNPIPPTGVEQRAIAAALDDANALIGALDRLIAKKRDLKQAAMQRLLTPPSEGGTRLPGFKGDWKVKTLGQLGRFLKGSGISKSQAASGEVPCVRYGELYTRHNDRIREFHSWISHDVAIGTMRLRRGDILFAGSGETKEEIGKCAAFTHVVEAYAGGDIIILRTEDGDAHFLGYYLNTAPIARQKASRGQGDAVVHISAAALSAIKGRFPETKEQTAIAAALSDMDTELAALENRRDKTRALKQAMMQELLTGKTRLVPTGDAHA